MDTVKVEQYIHCTKKRRGSGTETFSPIRIVEEVFTVDGKLVAENDPFGNVTAEELLSFLKEEYSEVDEKIHKDKIAHYFTL